GGGTNRVSGSALARTLSGRRLPDQFAEDQPDVGGVDRYGTRSPLARIPAVDRGLYQRDRCAVERAGDGSPGRAAILRLVRRANSRDGFRSARLYGGRCAVSGE